MRVDHVPFGECVNESERIAVEHVLSKLRSHGAPNNRWIVLSNVPSAVNDRAIPDEIDLVCIGTSGFFVIEVKVHAVSGFIACIVASIFGFHLFASFIRLLYDGGINEYEDPDQPFPKGHVQIMTIHQQAYSFTGDLKLYETCPRQYQFFREYGR